MDERSRRASETIWRLRQAGEVIETLPVDLRPTTRLEGYAVQAGLERFSSTPRCGWKIAATSVAGQQHIGVDQPVAGRLFAEGLVKGNSTVSIANNRMRVAEPEFAFRLSRDLPPREMPYDMPEVMTAVGDLHLCIELPDSRFSNFATVGGPSLIADNACARDLVVGGRVEASWRVLDLATHPVIARVGMRYSRKGIGSNVLGDPRLALVWLVNEISSLGLTLYAGELITTGACAVPLEIEPGDSIVADFGVLGSVSVKIGS